MLKLEHVTKIYRTTDVETLTLDDLCLAVSRGEFLAIVGPSGCGKSTLLNILGLVDSPSSGSYWFLGNDVARCSQDELTRPGLTASSECSMGACCAMPLRSIPQLVRWKLESPRPQTPAKLDERCLMLRNYLITALRNLARHKLHAGISIFGLAIGICRRFSVSCQRWSGT